MPVCLWAFESMYTHVLYGSEQASELLFLLLLTKLPCDWCPEGGLSRNYDIEIESNYFGNTGEQSMKTEVLTIELVGFNNDLLFIPYIFIMKSVPYGRWMHTHTQAN